MDTDMRRAAADDDHDDEHENLSAKKKSSSGPRAPAVYWILWPELLRKTFGICPEICTCGSKMVMVDVITDRQGIGEMMAKMGLAPMPPPLGRVAVPSGELQYLYEE
jgi:hypothetical protein